MLITSFLRHRKMLVWYGTSQDADAQSRSCTGGLNQIWVGHLAYHWADLLCG
jgi:hypothetical protein